MKNVHAKPPFITGMLIVTCIVSITVFGWQTTNPGDLSQFQDYVLDKNAVRLYMNSSGEGWVEDWYKSLWYKVPQDGLRPIPAFCKTSDTMALIYGNGRIAVLTINRGWVRPDTGMYFSAYTHTKIAPYVTSSGRNIVFAAGPFSSGVYDFLLGKWYFIQQSPGMDETTIPTAITISGDTVTMRPPGSNITWSYTAANGAWVQTKSK